MKLYALALTVLLGTPVFAQQPLPLYPPHHPPHAPTQPQVVPIQPGYLPHNNDARCVYTWRQYRRDREACYGDYRCERHVERRRERCRMVRG
jgi:hypothetical protein